jgi:branched-chain amino acid aminotransferase
MAGDIIFINGTFLPLSEARISPMDRGFLYGDALFETMRVYQRKVFRFEDHARRLASSAAALRIALPFSSQEMHKAIRSLLDANQLGDASVRIALSRGEGPRGPSIRGPFQPTLVIVASAFHGYPTDWHEKGVRAIISRIRLDVTSPLPAHKTANYLLYILARAEAEEAGAAEALLLNTRGEVAEAATSNVFMVRGGTVCTPALSANILPGVTRKVVLDICKQQGLPCDERIFRPDQLMAADEVFLTNSLMEIMPVIAIDGNQIGHGVPGPVTRRLRAAYQELVRRE